MFQGSVAPGMMPAAPEKSYHDASPVRLSESVALSPMGIASRIAVSSVGGWVSTRASGQFSTAYGNIEGALDTAHFSFLHMPVWSADDAIEAAVRRSSVDVERTRWMRDDPRPEFHVVPHETGFVAGAARKADGNDLYWRIAQYLLPNHALTPNAFPGENIHAQTWVPITDESCWIYTYAWHPDRPLTADERAKFEKGGYGQFAELGPGYVPLRNRSNDYLIDREDQKHRSFTGVRGIAEQDALAQDSQGLIADRTREHLTATDAAIVRFRRLMLGEAKALREGREPAAVGRPESYRVRGGGAHTSALLSFEEVMRERFGSTTGRVK